MTAIGKAIEDVDANILWPAAVALLLLVGLFDQRRFGKEQDGDRQ